MCKLRFPEDRHHDQNCILMKVDTYIYWYILLEYRKPIITKIKVARNVSERYKTAHQISKKGRKPGLGNRKASVVLQSCRRMVGPEVLQELLHSR